MFTLRFYNSNRVFQFLFQRSVWRIPSPKKVVYFTFDDGPTPEVTPYVLDMLDKYKAKATFFNVGENVLKNPILHQDVLKRGHKVGNHTQHHHGAWRVDNNVWLDDVKEAQEYIKSNLFRPPYGELTWKLQRRLKKLGFKIIMWSFITYDWDENSDPYYSIELAKKLKGNGHIIVMHDQPKALKNLQIILPALLEYYAAKGFEFRAITS